MVKKPGLDKDASPVVSWRGVDGRGPPMTKVPEPVTMALRDGWPIIVRAELATTDVVRMSGRGAVA